MITPKGYSKDPSIIPDGIVITWKRDMFPDNSFDAVMRLFEHELNNDGAWVQKALRAPKYDVQFVYIIIDGEVKYRCNYAGWSNDRMELTRKNGITYNVPWPRILITGPVIKPSIKINLKGFQGFRYCTELF